MSRYHELSIAEKQAYSIGLSREPAVECPLCGTKTTAADLLAHMDARCDKRKERAPHPGAKWLRWSEILALGVPAATISRWVSQEKVRTRGQALDRVYLLRDVVVLVAERKTRPSGWRVSRKRRRKSH